MVCRNGKRKLTYWILMHVRICASLLVICFSKQNPHLWSFLLACILHIHLFLFSIHRHVDGFYTEIATWLVQWLLLRFMFAAGIVKLTSHCNTWWSLTALNYHYESQVQVHVQCMYAKCVYFTAYMYICTWRYTYCTCTCLFSSICIWEWSQIQVCLGRICQLHVHVLWANVYTWTKLVSVCSWPHQCVH